MVDARGLLCPMPVVMVQKEVKANKPAALDVLVDDPCAVENVTRFSSPVAWRRLTPVSLRLVSQKLPLAT